MLKLIYHLIEAIEPIIVPLCFAFAWIFLILLLLTLKSAFVDAMNRAKQMHEIPCTNCQFFTNDYRLKCTVQPHIANTENAINCFDYRSKQ